MGAYDMLLYITALPVNVELRNTPLFANPVPRGVNLEMVT